MNWKDEQLEDLLRELPKIKDRRNSHELYHAVSLKLDKKRKIGKFIPGIASLTAIILFFILVPSLFQFDDGLKRETSQDSKMMDANKDNRISFKEEADRSNEAISSNEQQLFDTMLNTEQLKIAVYEEDLVGKELLIYGIPDRQALNVVPVSILVNKDESNNWFDQFIDYMPKLTEEAWGLSEYYPLHGEITFDKAEKLIHIDLKQNHPYGQGSASELNFQSAILTAFRERQDVNLITFSTENKPGIMFGNNELERMDLTRLREARKPYLLLYLENKQQPMLVPAHDPVATLEEAITVMKKDEPNQGLFASIPDELQIEKISVLKNQVAVQLSNQSNISQTPEINFAIEAILLSAKEFGYSTVEFKHDKIPEIGSFPINQPIEVPIAANKHEIK